MIKLLGGAVLGAAVAYLYFKPDHKRLDEVEGHLKSIQKRTAQFLSEHGWSGQEVEEKVTELTAKPA